MLIYYHNAKKLKTAHKNFQHRQYIYLFKLFRHSFNSSGLLLTYVQYKQMHKLKMEMKGKFNCNKVGKYVVHYYLHRFWRYVSQAYRVKFQWLWNNNCIYYFYLYVHSSKVTSLIRPGNDIYLFLVEEITTVLFFSTDWRQCMRSWWWSTVLYFNTWEKVLCGQQQFNHLSTVRPLGGQTYCILTI